MSTVSLARPRLIALGCLLATLPGALAILTPPGGARAAASSPPSPHLRVFWAARTFRCWTAIERVRVRHGKKVTVHKHRVRRCGDRPTRARGRDLRLRWRQTGEAFGRLTIGKQPIANAPVTLNWTIPGWQAGTNVVSTNARGRFTMIIVPGPSKILTVSYSPAPGQVIAIGKRVDAAASISLHVSALTAGRRAHFYGVVRGGYIPENLYVEFWYLAGSGWQPFAQPTFVGREDGHFNTHIRIPPAAAGYFYEIKASVVRTPTWPWAHTESRVVSRYVS